MTPRTNLGFLGLMALSAAFAAPMAFAQNNEAKTDPANPAAAQPAAAATPTDAAASTKKTWSDLDSNKDGNLDKTEAANIPSLQAVFDQADANADGALTGEEYKTYLAANSPAAKPRK